MRRWGRPEIRWAPESSGFCGSFIGESMLRTPRSISATGSRLEESPEASAPEAPAGSGPQVFGSEAIGGLALADPAPRTLPAASASRSRIFCFLDGGPARVEQGVFATLRQHDLQGVP